MCSDAKDRAYNAGIISFEDVLDSAVKLNNLQLLQVKTAVHNLPPYIAPYSIRQFLNGLKPYRQIPFQYSLHIQDKPCAEPEHREFLAEEGEDPRRAVA